MTGATKTDPRTTYTQLAPTFTSWDRAMRWAEAVARTGHRRCKVKRDGIEGRPWRVHATPRNSHPGGGAVES